MTLVMPDGSPIPEPEPPPAPNEMARVVEELRIIGNRILVARTAPNPDDRRIAARRIVEVDAGRLVNVTLELIELIAQGEQRIMGMGQRLNETAKMLGTVVYAAGGEVRVPRKATVEMPGAGGMSAEWEEDELVLRFVMPE